MPKQNNIPSISIDLQKEAKKIQKDILQEKSKSSSLHDQRVFFKKMKSYIGFMVSLSGSELKLPDLLQEYYTTIGDLRDAQVFAKQCNKYLEENQIIEELCEDRLQKASKKLADFFGKHKPSLIVKQLRNYLTLLDARYKIFEQKWIEAGLQTYITRQETIIKQHLFASTITDAVVHDMRKKIKKLIYLMPYLPKNILKIYAKKIKKYKKLGEQIGSRNDLNHLVDELGVLPRKGDEAKTLEKLQTKEQKKLHTVLEKLKAIFGMQQHQFYDTTRWINKKDISEKKSIQTSVVPSITKKRSLGKKSKKHTDVSSATLTEVVKNNSFSTKSIAPLSEKKTKKSKKKKQ